MPAYHAELSIQGLQELQVLNNRMILALDPQSATGRAVQLVAIDLERYAIGIAHTDTGAMRAAIRMAMFDDYAEIFIDPGAVNPRTGQRPAEYALFEEARGGSHAFFTRTIEERGDDAIGRALDFLEAQL